MERCGIRPDLRSRARRPVGLVAFGLALAAGSAHAEPRPLTPAERAATEFATRYLADGPEAWWAYLAATSPMSKMDREAAEAEIEVRAGPRNGARWTLQTVPPKAQGLAVFTIEYTTGIDETLTLELVETAGGSRILNMWTAAEPTPVRQPEAEASPETASGRAGIPPVPSTVLLAIVGALGACLMAARVTCKWPLRGVQWAGLITAALILAPCAGKSTDEDSAGNGTGSGGSAYLELGSLAELRRALLDEDLAAPAIATDPREGDVGRVARLWRAQARLADEDLNGAADLLNQLPEPGQVPMTEILRARVALMRLQEIEAALAYERAFELGVHHDGLLFEMAQAFEVLGFEERAAQARARLAKMGSREADVYYGLAAVAVLDGRIPAAVRHFNTGWYLRPLERGEVLRHPLLTGLLEDFSVRELLQIHAAEEPRPKCPVGSSGSLAVPAEASPRLLGGLLMVELEGGEVLVPGGCEVAPENSAVYDARSWRKRRDVLILSELSVANASTRSTGALAQPHLRRKLEEAAEALARRNRWAELVELTEGLKTDLARLPSTLVRLRADALQRIGRTDDARRLLIALAKSNREERRIDSATLVQLAELLVSQGEFDTAIRLMTKAMAELPFEVSDLRLQQMRMERRLAEAYSVHKTENFEVQYPTGKHPYLAERAGQILEAEFERLQKWIPLERMDTVEVSLLPWRDFRSSWTGSSNILCLYDGKTRLPFAEVPEFTPWVVSILTHELAHAMIAERTDNRAPKWFHEALAQHVEMAQTQSNPIESYSIKRSLIAFPLLEDILWGFTSPLLVTVAYNEAAWSMHFVETRYGVDSIHRLLEAFDRGRSTEEAVAEVFDRSLDEFDYELWNWCLYEAPPAWTTEIVRYDTRDS